MNYSPDKWGPSIWFVLEQLCFAYPHVRSPTYEEQSSMIELLEVLKFVLPCSTCRNEYCMLLEENNWSELKYNFTKNRENLCIFVNHIHNSVNKRLNKKVYFIFEHMQATLIRSYDKETLEKNVFVTMRSVSTNFSLEHVSFFNVFLRSICIFLPDTCYKIRRRLLLIEDKYQKITSQRKYAELMYIITRDYHSMTFEEFLDF
jgi:hypothetical protein